MSFSSTSLCGITNIFLLYIQTASSSSPNIPLTDSQEPLCCQAQPQQTWLPLAFGKSLDICIYAWSRESVIYPGVCRGVMSRSADTVSYSYLYFQEMWGRLVKCRALAWPQEALSCRQEDKQPCDPSALYRRPCLYFCVELTPFPTLWPCFIPESYWQSPSPKLEVCVKTTQTASPVIGQQGLVIFHAYRKFL